MKVYFSCLRSIVINSVGLVCLFALFVPSANAATLTKQTGPNGVPGVDYCLNIEEFNAYTTGMGNNFFDSYADIYNGCGSTVTGVLRLFASNNSCIGIGNGGASQGFNFTIRNGETFDSPIAGWAAGCVVCENGVPINYPSFSIRNSALASGTFGSGKSAGSYGSSPITIDLTNDPPEVYPPC